MAIPHNPVSVSRKLKTLEAYAQLYMLIFGLIRKHTRHARWVTRGPVYHRDAPYFHLLKWFLNIYISHVVYLNTCISHMVHTIWLFWIKYSIRIVGGVEFWGVFSMNKKKNIVLEKNNKVVVQFRFKKMGWCKCRGGLSRLYTCVKWSI